MTRFEQLALDEALGIAMASQIMTASLLLHVAERDPSGIPALREPLDAHARILEGPHAASCYSRAALGLARSLLASRQQSLAAIEQEAG